MNDEESSNPRGFAPDTATDDVDGTDGEGREEAMRRLDHGLAVLAIAARMALVQRYRPDRLIESGLRDDPAAFAAALRQFDTGLNVLSRLSRLVADASLGARAATARAGTGSPTE